jgi:hypothetical protein
MDKLKKTENSNKKQLNAADMSNGVESIKHRNLNILSQANLNMHNTTTTTTITSTSNNIINSNSLDKRVINGAKKLTPLTGSRSSSSSNRYQTAAMASAIDFDYLEEKLKQIQANSDHTKKLLPSNSTSYPILKSSIKPTTSHKSSEEKFEIDSSNKKINFKIKESTHSLKKSPSSKKELQRSISNLDHQRPVTTNTLKQKISLNSKKEKLQNQATSQLSQQNRAHSQLSYSTNRLNTSNSHYDSQPIYEDDFIDDYTDDDEEKDHYFKHKQDQDNKKENFFNGKHIPNRSVSNMSYSNKIKHHSSLLNKKSKSTHLSHMEINSSSIDMSSESENSSSNTSRSSSSFDNIVKLKKSNRLKAIDKDRRINSANNKTNLKTEPHEPHSHPLNTLQPRRASTANLGTPRSITIRREKSTNNDRIDTNRSNFSERNLLDNFMEDELPKDNQEKNFNLKQNLLASITNSGISNKESSSTTSGIESSSKNSTANGNESNECKISIENNSSFNSPNNNCNNRNINNYVLKINELKNSIFVLEIELKNERKKLNVEKDLKEKLVVELKKRFHVEKEAALKAQEAKLNAEKLLELNKVKDEIDLEKRDEYYQNQKTFDTELINLQIKLREKSEK